MGGANMLTRASGMAARAHRHVEENAGNGRHGGDGAIEHQKLSERSSERYLVGRRRMPVEPGSLYAKYLWLIAREPIQPHETQRLVRAQAYDLLVYIVFMLTTVLVATLSCNFLNPLGVSRGEQDFYQSAAAIKNQLTGVEMKDAYVSNFAKTFEDIATVEESARRRLSGRRASFVAGGRDHPRAARVGTTRGGSARSTTRSSRAGRSTTRTRRRASRRASTACSPAPRSGR